MGARVWRLRFSAFADPTFSGKGKEKFAVVVTEKELRAIAANEVYMACRKSGMDEGTALAFAMDRASYPDWIVDTQDPIKNPLDDFDEDE